MAHTKWEFTGSEFINCNCSYGCPCQFNALPTNGFCQAVGGFQIDEGHYGDTRLDGLRFVGIFRWPKAIHEGGGECVVVIDEKAMPEQRKALLRIVSGEDTKPGATVFQVFASTMVMVHDPIFAPIDFKVDVDARRAKLVVPGITEGRGAPIVNPVTNEEHRVRIDLPDGFEYTLAEIGRGWTNVNGPIKMTLNDSYGQFSHIHLSQDGVVH